MTLPRLAAFLAALALSVAPAWAQAENIGKGVDLGVHAAGNIADQGGLIGSIAIAVGCLSLLLHCAQGWAIVSLYKALQSLQDKRATDAVAAAREVAQTSIAGTEAITKSGERLADHSARIQTLAERLLPVPDGLANVAKALEAFTTEFRLARGRSPGASV